MNPVNNQVGGNGHQTVYIPPPWFGKCCIYKVPKKLRQVNPEAYTPQFVSVGPIHYNHLELIPMEKRKQAYSIKFRERVLQLKHNRVQEVDDILGKFKAYIVDNVDKILNHYEEDAIDLSIVTKQKFIEVIELDAIFIMELFLRKIERKSGKHKDDYILSKPWLRLGVMHDLILLENQIPFHVLEALYEFVPEIHFRNGRMFRFLEVARKYFANFDPQQRSKEVRLKSFDGIKHFTDLIRHFYLPIDLIRGTDDREVHPWYSASKLAESGVKFIPITNRCLLDIRFEKQEFLNWLPFLSCLPFIKCVKAYFEIPKLILDDSTESILRNLISLEQCLYPREAYVCSYVLLLNHLLISQSDVDLLVGKKVIINGLGNNEDASVLVNSLCKEVLKTTNCYNKHIRRLNEHYDNMWNRYMATLKNVYFCDLWRASSTVVGLAVLFFTFFSFFQSLFKKDNEN